MKRLYEAGEVGEFEYAECEYVHNCESIWPSISYGDPNHWRNWIAPEVYEKMRQMWGKEKNAEDGYTQRSFKQGSGK